MLRAIFVFALLFTAHAHAADNLGGLSFEHTPQPCECYPNNPMSKKYLSTTKTWFGERRVYTCDFTCLAANGQESTVTGTQTDSYSFSDDGSHFVCRGFVMKYTETPFDPNRFGVMMLEGVQPFSALNSDVEEISSWAKGNCAR